MSLIHALVDNKKTLWFFLIKLIFNLGESAVNGTAYAESKARKGICQLRYLNVLNFLRRRFLIKGSTFVS